MALEKCAGILFRAEGPRYLLIKNADDGRWVQPGGHLEDGETVEEGAVRETYEEVGQVPDGDRWMLRRSFSEDVDFTCFIQDTKTFTPHLDDESTDWGWFPFTDLPKGIHPEVKKSIDLISGTELDVAKAIRYGELFSPQKYENMWLFDVRITGTGISYRDTKDEYVFRDPEVFLDDDFVERCNGLPLIFEHPEDSLLNTEQYRDRSIGNVILPYVQLDDVRGIAKVLDADAAKLMRTSHVSTSPAVDFRDAGSTQTIEFEDGKKLFVEKGKPSLLDHLAICVGGVWDKGGKPTGVNIEGDHNVAKENETPAWADSIHKKLDSMHKRLDAIENKGGDRMDGEEGEEEEEEMKLDNAFGEIGEEGLNKAEREIGKLEEGRSEEERKDSEEEEEEEGKGGEEEEEEEADSAACADSKGEKEGVEIEVEEKEDSRPRKDSQSKTNASLRKQLSEMESRMANLSRPLSSADRDALSEAQSRADGIAQMHGRKVNPPLHGESPIAYRKRLADSLKKFSPDPEIRKFRLDSVSGKGFDLIEDRIYSDAEKSALNPEKPVVGRLTEIKRADAAGRVITRYTGDMKAWMQFFEMPGAVVKPGKAFTKENR